MVLSNRHHHRHSWRLQEASGCETCRRCCLGAMRLKPLATVLACGIAAAVPALALSGCGSSGASPASSPSRSTTTTTTPAKLAITPPQGTPATSFTFTFTAPDAAGRSGQTNLGYELGLRGPEQTGCLAARTAAVPRATAGRQVSVTVDPARVGGLWCQGAYSARVTELQTPVCQPGEMCPQFIRVVRTVANGEFRVTSP
jgi:hypothetical protein